MTTAFNPPRASAGNPAIPATRYLTVNGGQIAYDDTGNNGPLVLAIPGMGEELKASLDKFLTKLESLKG